MGSDPAHSFHPPDSGRKLRTEQAGIGSLVRDAPNGGQAQVDRGRCVLLLFEVDSVSRDDSAIECEARL